MIIYHQIFSDLSEFDFLDLVSDLLNLMFVSWSKNALGTLGFNNNNDLSWVSSSTVWAYCWNFPALYSRLYGCSSFTQQTQTRLQVSHFKRVKVAHCSVSGHCSRCGSDERNWNLGCSEDTDLCGWVWRGIVETLATDSRTSSFCHPLSQSHFTLPFALSLKLPCCLLQHIINVWWWPFP